MAPHLVYRTQARSQPVFSGKPEGPFCLSYTFIFQNERNWMKKSARVSEKTGKPGLTWFTGSYAPGTSPVREGAGRMGMGDILLMSLRNCLTCAPTVAARTVATPWIHFECHYQYR